ncbi:MAG: carbohydrate-binding family 9-like protein [Candidatus Ratteibacteria bacterium]
MRKNILILFILFSSFIWAERELYIAERVKNKIVIDGNITEEWGKPTIERFYRADGINKKVNSKTQVWIKYDDNCLYIAGKMEDKDVIGKVKENKGPVWNDDVFEIFIKPKFNSSHYYEINFNPLGTMYDAFYPKARIYHYVNDYSSGAIGKVKINGTLNNFNDVDNGWEIEVAIPFSAFSKTTNPPKKGDIWYFAICRYDYSYYLPYKGVENTSSAKLRRLDFHLFYDYDKLLFK